MSCCSSSGTCGCPVQPCPSKYVTAWLPRIAFGLALAGPGVNHYRHLESFVMNAKAVFPTVQALASIAGVLAYVVPALMIVGGVLFAVRQLCCISKICIVTALTGIIGWAGLAILVGDEAIGKDMMGAIQGAIFYLVLYVLAKKMSCCSVPAGCSSGNGKCA